MDMTTHFKSILLKEVGQCVDNHLSVMVQQENYFPGTAICYSFLLLHVSGVGVLTPDVYLGI
jgi:hypothetical protein